MARAATARLKVNPPLGRLPVLQFMAPGELQIDATYQRSIDSGPSQTLIRKIAQHWNWDLCLPLVVSRRAGGLFVIDGQHRWEAAKLRGDIAQLPCVVVDYASSADEAASFVHLNQQRRPLSKLDVFKAAVASEDPQACAVLAAIEAAGLKLAPHSNYTTWKPRMIANIGGVESAWRDAGPDATRAALEALALAWPREVLRYGGTVFPGIVAICLFEAARGEEVRPSVVAQFVRGRSQMDWRGAIMTRRAHHPSERYSAAARSVFRIAWREFCDLPDEEAGEAPVEALPAFRADEEGMGWCDQCDMRVTREQASGCKSRFCSFKEAA